MGRPTGSDVVERVQRASDLAAIVGETVVLRRRGRKLWGLCPFHAEKTPSFSVDPERQLFYCFGCRTGGNVFTYVMRRDGRTFPEALAYLAERAGIALEGDTGRTGRRGRLFAVLAEAARRYRAWLREPERGRAARAYLARRGVPEEWAERFELGYAPDGWDALTLALSHAGYPVDEAVEAGLLVRRNQGGVYDRLRHRLVFPIHDPDGRVVAFGGRALGDEEPKYLNLPDTPVFQKGQVLFGARWAREAWRTGPPLVVEGYFDVLAAHRAGLTGAVASLGTALTADHARYLARFADRVVLCYDRDPAGAEAAARAFVVLAETGLSVYVMEVPAGKDLDESLVQAGPEALREAYAAAEPYLAWRIRKDAYAVRVGAAEKARALKTLLPLLQAVSDPVERAGYIELLERVWAVDHKTIAQALRREQGAGHNSRNSRHNMGRRQEKNGLPDDGIILLGLLLQFPDGLEGVLTTLPELCSDPRWVGIIEHWEDVGRMPVALWVEALPPPARELAMAALAEDVDWPRSALTELVGRMRRKWDEERWNALQARAAQGPLDAELEAEIRRLWPRIRAAKQAERGEG